MVTSGGPSPAENALQSTRRTSPGSCGNRRRHRRRWRHSEPLACRSGGRAVGECTGRHGSACPEAEGQCHAAEGRRRSVTYWMKGFWASSMAYCTGVNSGCASAAGGGAVFMATWRNSCSQAESDKADGTHRAPSSCLQTSLAGGLGLGREAAPHRDACGLWHFSLRWSWVWCRDTRVALRAPARVACLFCPV